MGFPDTLQMSHMRSKRCRAHRPCLLCLWGCLAYSSYRDASKCCTHAPNIVVLNRPAFLWGGSEILVFETTPPNVARAFQTLPCPSLLPVRFIGGVWGGQVAEIPPNVAHMRSKHSRAHRPHLCCLLGVSRKPGFSRRPQMLHMRSKHCRAHRSCLLCLLRGCLGNSGCRDTPRLFHTCDPNIAVLIALARVVYWGGVSKT